MNDSNDQNLVSAERSVVDAEGAPVDVPMPQRSTRIAVVTQIALIVVPTLAFAWLLRLMLVRNPAGGGWVIQILVALTTLVTCCWNVIHRQRWWEKPTRDLVRMHSMARRGVIPIEELSQITGGVLPLVQIVQDLLYDLKQQKVEVSKLNDEMRQRVAVRTDALERKIGSLQLQAMRDALTGLYNRRALEAELPRVVESYRGGGPQCCLLMIDVDHFKMLNDTLGHAAGDQLLRELGQLIRGTIRDEDLAFRVGGDEFVVLLHGADLRAGRAIGSRLESLVVELTQTLKVLLPPRLSIGICALDEISNPSVEAWSKAADERLYDIKATRPRSRGTSPTVKIAG